MKEQPLIEAGAQKILSLADETKFADNGIVSRTVFRSPHCRVVLFGFAEGQELSEHTSTQHALVQILSGECEFSLAGKPHHLKAGDLLCAVEKGQGLKKGEKAIRIGTIRIVDVQNQRGHCRNPRIAKPR